MFPIEGFKLDYFCIEFRDLKNNNRHELNYEARLWNWSSIALFKLYYKPRGICIYIYVYFQNSLRIRYTRIYIGIYTRLFATLAER